jgi:hypothetical protein
MIPSFDIAQLKRQLKLKLKGEGETREFVSSAVLRPVVSMKRWAVHFPVSETDNGRWLALPHLALEQPHRKPPRLLHGADWRCDGSDRSFLCLIDWLGWYSYRPGWSGIPFDSFIPWLLEQDGRSLESNGIPFVDLFPQGRSSPFRRNVLDKLEIRIVSDSTAWFSFRTASHTLASSESYDVDVRGRQANATILYQGVFPGWPVNHWIPYEYLQGPITGGFGSPGTRLFPSSPAWQNYHSWMAAVKQQYQSLNLVMPYISCVGCI